MPETTYLHIQTRDATPTRVLEIPGVSIRIGRGAQCEARLSGPGVADVQCLLRRRGEKWHLQPLGPAGGVLIDGRAVEHPRPLPMGVPFRVGECWLTLRPEDSPQSASWGSYEPPSMIGTPTVDAAVDLLPGDPGNDGAQAEAECDRLKHWQSRLEQRQRWLNERREEQRWEARWKAAGEAIRSRSEPAGPRTSRPVEPAPITIPFTVDEDRSPPIQPAPAEPSSFPSIARMRAAFQSNPRSAPPVPDRDATKSHPREEEGDRHEGETPSGPASFLEGSTLGVEDAGRVLFDSSPPQPIAAEEHPWNDAFPLPNEDSPFDMFEAREKGESTDPALGSFEEVPDGTTGSPIHPKVEIYIPTQAERVQSTEPIFVEPPKPIDLDRVRRIAAASHEVAPPQQPQAESRSTAKPRESRRRKTPREGSTGAHLLAPAEPAAPAPVAAPPSMEPPAPAEVIEPASKSIGSKVADPIAPNTGAEAIREGEWPSARSIFAERAARDGESRESATPRSSARKARPEPTLGRAPAHWRMPLLGLVWLPATMIVMAIGGAGLSLSWFWSQDDRAAGLAADRLLASNAEILKPQEASSLLDAMGPDPAWWRTTASHQLMRAFVAGRSGDEERSRFLLKAARHDAPANAGVRYALAHQKPGGTEEASTVESLGLSRDVVSLAWMGHVLLASKKIEAAKAAYRHALEMACRVEPERLAPPAFLGDRQGRRYELPYEDLLGAVVHDMADSAEWSHEQWSEALPPVAIAHLAAARVLKEKGIADAEKFLDSATAQVEPSSPPFAVAVHRAVQAEAAAMRDRWEDADAAYRRAILDMTDERTRRAWWMNVAEIQGRLNDDAKRLAAWESAKNNDPNDEITRRAIEAQVQSGVHAVVGDSNAKGSISR